MKKLIFYPGRFQPFGPHHLAVYETLCETFKGDTVYILTSNKVDSDKSPFSFKEKRDIMESMGVPRERIVQVVNPYKPTELTSKLKPNT
jgi:nicotinamide mononucleotide adenylyltransferase